MSPLDFSENPSSGLLGKHSSLWRLPRALPKSFRSRCFRLKKKRAFSSPFNRMSKFWLRFAAKTTFVGHELGFVFDNQKGEGGQKWALEILTFHKTKHFDKSTSAQFGAGNVVWVGFGRLTIAGVWTEVNLVCKERGLHEIWVDGV